MARTSVSKTDLSGAYGGTTDALSMTSADTSNDTEVDTLQPGDILIAHNTDTSSHNITITSTDTNKAGRKEDISSESIAADEIRAFGPLELDGWRQSDGSFHFTADNSAVEFAVISGSSSQL